MDSWLFLLIFSVVYGFLTYKGWRYMQNRDWRIFKSMNPPGIFVGDKIQNRIARLVFSILIGWIFGFLYIVMFILKYIIG